jgi:hypothetical protein
MRQLEETLARYPEARSTLTGQLGDERMAELARAATAINDAMAALTPPRDAES